MTDKLNRCYFQAASSGSGDFVYASTVAGFMSPTDAGAVDTREFAYIAENGTPPTEWELGIGAYDAGTGTLARTTVVDSSNAGAVVTFSAAPKVRMGVPLAADFATAYLYLVGSNFDGVFDVSGTGVVQAFLDATTFTSISFKECTYLNRLTIVGTGNNTSVDVDGCSALVFMSIGGTSVTTLSTAGMSSLDRLDAQSNGNLSTVDLSGATALTSLQIFSCALTSIDVTASTLLTYFDASDNPAMTSADISASSLLTGVYLNGNALDGTNVDGVLTALDGFGLSGGEVDLSGGTNASPGALGLAAKASLELRGWTVTVN